MAANFETGFFVGTPAWHGLGTVIKNAPTSADAIKIAQLDWDVVPTPIFDQFGNVIPGYKVNQRSSDKKNLGIVTDRYRIVQNRDAFAFIDELLGQGVTFETAGSLASGKRVWMLARLEDRLMAEEEMENYLVFTNTHDGTGAIRVACTGVRVVCQNTLNLALSNASRHWSCVHKGDIQSKLDEARYTLQNANRYMDALEEEFGELKLKKITETDVMDMTEALLKSEFDDLYKKATTVTGKVIDLKAVQRQQKYEEKLNTKRKEILNIYFDKPDLRGTEHTAFRFVMRFLIMLHIRQTTATHATIRKTCLCGLSMDIP